MKKTKINKPRIEHSPCGQASGRVQALKAARWLTFSVCCLLAGSISAQPAALGASSGGDSDKTNLRFASTQKWDSELLELVGHFPGWFTEEDFKSFVLMPPPSNDSAETQAELSYLVALVEHRSDEEQKEIEQEIPLSGFWMPELIAIHGGPKQFPHTEELIFTTMAEAAPVVMSLKHQFDRVRPHFLTNAMDPSIEPPGHPAYPSGHATQSALLAFIYTDLDPAGRDRYLADARRTAWHRELAGVHYPSDSAAGSLLAYQLYERLKTKPQFQALLSTARKEWSAALHQGVTARRVAEVEDASR